MQTSMMRPRWMRPYRRTNAAACRLLIVGWMACCLVLATSVVSTPWADDYPSQNVRIVVPFSPGAALDIIARLIAQKLAEQSGKTVIVDNRPGGAGLIGAEAVARSEPNGHTLLFTPDDLYTIIPHVTKTKSFDPNRQLIPVAAIGKAIDIVVVNPSVPATTLSAFIDYVRAHPSALSYGSNGAGTATQLAFEVLKRHAKLDVVHVPYRGKAQAVMATVSGEVQMTIIGYGTALGLINEGKLRPVVVAGSEREPGLPELATMAELGFPDVDVTTWFTISAPAGTPQVVVQQIDDAIARVIKSSDIRNQLESRYIVVRDVGSKDLTQSIAQRYRANGEAVRLTGVSLD